MGMPIIEVCEKAEGLIREKGGQPAFPCNVSINEAAAHYTSPPGDERRIPEKSVVKVDIGAHIDGYLTDTAITICFDPEYADLVEAAQEALRVAITQLRPDVKTSRIGSAIEKAIRSYGFKPISNLTGHQVGRYLVHAGMSIPNVSHVSLSKVRLNGVYAIEPFVTMPSAAGKVKNGEEVTIFRLRKSRSLRNTYAKQLLKHIREEFKTLPFAERWLENVVPEEQYKDAFEDLLSTKVLMGYPIFVEATKKPVAQAEHTVLIVEDGCRVLT